jgi:hypothetical protein
MISKAKSHDMSREIPESKVYSTFGHGRQIYLEKIYGKFTVDISKLEFVFVPLIFC